MIILCAITPPIIVLQRIVFFFFLCGFFSFLLIFIVEVLSGLLFNARTASNWSSWDSSWIWTAQILVCGHTIVYFTGALNFIACCFNFIYSFIVAITFTFQLSF
jgi:hypothetical protein